MDLLAAEFAAHCGREYALKLAHEPTSVQKPQPAHTLSHIASYLLLCCIPCLPGGSAIGQGLVGASAATFVREPECVFYRATASPSLPRMPANPWRYGRIEILIS